jgi:hypothetical protein
MKDQPAAVTTRVAGGGAAMCWTRGSAEARERGNELRRVDCAPPAGQVITRPGVEAGDAGEGVIAGGDFATRIVAEAPSLDITADDPLNQHGSGGGPMSLREVLVGMIGEYARHMGHADLLRERIDGRIGQ